MKKAAFHTLGCKVNAYETEVMREQLKEHGYEIVPFSETADVYVINTCTVTNVADQKSRQMIHKARKKNPDAIVAAVGCYAQASKEELLKDKTADLIIGSNQKSRLYELLEAFERDRVLTEAVEDVRHERSYEDMFMTQTDDRTRAFLKVQDGCNQFCSYCLIPYARGRARSRDLNSVITEIKTLAEKGFKEIVLTGIHLTSYGYDMTEDKRSLLKELIMEASLVEGIERIRLGSLEPNVITEDFVKEMAGNKKFCPHFHLSMQSGCTETLKRMNRHYTASEYLEKCQLIREYFDHPAITTDVIAGFPGETEEEFEKTLAHVKQVDFAQMHVFKYSRRKGTKADTMPDQVPEQVKTARSHLLMEAAGASEKAFVEYYIGKEVEILTEDTVESDGKLYRIGQTKTYVKCLIPESEENPIGPNQLVRARAVRVTERSELILE